MLSKVVGLILSSMLSISLNLKDYCEVSIENPTMISYSNPYNYLYPDTCIPDEYIDYIIEISDMYGIQPELIMAIIETESRGIPTVVNETYGCYGLMQINKSCHLSRMDRLGVTDLYDPYSNILVGVDYLMEMSEDYEDIAEVLMHYHGEKNVNSKLESGKLSNYANTILNRAHELELLHYGS